MGLATSTTDLRLQFLASIFFGRLLVCRKWIALAHLIVFARNSIWYKQSVDKCDREIYKQKQLYPKHQPNNIERIAVFVVSLDGFLRQNQ